MKLPRDRQARLALRVTLIAGAIAAVCSLLLIGDHVAAVRRAAADSVLIEALEAEVEADAEVAPRLEAERERQTQASLAREARDLVLAWILLVAGAGVVAAGRWYRSLRPQPLPSLESLVAERFPPPKPRTRKPGEAPADEPDAGEPTFAPAFVDALVARIGRGRESAIPLLQAIQDHYRYLPDEALRRVCELTEITAAQIAGTSSFYAQFRRSPVGRHVVRICHGTACHVAGAEQISAELRRHLEIPPDQDTDPRKLFTLDSVACLGCCSLAPVMMIEEETAGRLTPAGARQVLDGLEPPR